LSPNHDSFLFFCHFFVEKSNQKLLAEGTHSGCAFTQTAFSQSGIFISAFGGSEVYFIAFSLRL
jgi:hypothetical protein